MLVVLAVLGLEQWDIDFLWLVIYHFAAEELLIRRQIQQAVSAVVHCDDFLFASLLAF